jgi:ATP-binding cassette subfamily B protein
MSFFEEITWPRDQISTAIVALTVHCGFAATDRPLPPAATPNWLDEAGRALGVEFEQGNVADEELWRALRDVGPGILQLRGRILVVGRSSRREIEVVLPRGTRTCRYSEVLAALRERTAGSDEVPSLLQGVPNGAQILRRVLVSLDQESSFAAVSITLRVAATRSLSDELASLDLRKRLSGIAITLVLTDLASLGSTLLLTDLSMSGRLDGARLTGWGLGLLAMGGVQGLLSYGLGRLNIDLSATVKRRLVEGTFRYDLDQARLEGYGTVLSRAAQAGMLDTLSVADPVQLLHGVAMTLVALSLLASLQPSLVAVFFATVVLFCALLVARLFAASSVFDDQIALSDVYIDRILGHRTRVIQLPRALWHVGEDEPLFRYFQSIRKADYLGLTAAVLPRLWLLVGMALVLAQFISDARPDKLVLALAGVVMGQQALVALSSAAGRVSLWYNSLRKLSTFLQYAEAPEPEASYFRSTSPLPDGETSLIARGLRFNYGSGGPMVLDGVTLSFAAGDRVLVTGPSGGGKSTLSAILTGIRKPTAGIVMLRGLDQHSVTGSAWRRRVVSVPQFQENHIFQETLLFNLLMGGSWPAPPGERARAARLCDELGLGPLIDRMPSGLDQLLGDSGWQLSHGERSRVFMARALLQDADLVIFDESFGTLDPETLQIAMIVAKRYARTLMVIAHT